MSEKRREDGDALAIAGAVLVLIKTAQEQTALSPHQLVAAFKAAGSMIEFAINAHQSIMSADILQQQLSRWKPGSSAS